MTKEQIQGYMFEAVVASLLSRSGYVWDENIEETDFIRGRGCAHQIDAIGLASYAHPFISKMRLLAECKYKQDAKVGVDVVRNMVGVLQDVTQNYFSENYDIAEQILFNRYTDSGVVFSNTSFTKSAVSYGFAHNVFLISYNGNPVMQRVTDAFENICRHINFEAIESKKLARLVINQILETGINSPTRSLQDYLVNNINDVRVSRDIFEFVTLIRDTTSVLAFINGSYPIHIFSNSHTPLPKYFIDCDRNKDGILQVGYKFNWLSENDVVVFCFKVSKHSEEFYFTLPSFIFSQEKLASGNLIYEKEKFLNQIIIPIVKTNGSVSQLILKFNKKFIEEDW